MNAFELVKQVQSGIEEIVTRYEHASERFKELEEREIQDILHEIEFTPFDVFRGYQYAKLLQDARRERRDMIREREELKAAYECVNRYQQFRHEMHQSCKSARTKYYQARGCVYRPRADLTKTPNIHRLYEQSRYSEVAATKEE